MKYVLHNLSSLIKNEKFIFAVMIVCVIASAWIMAFSYGLYQNYNITLYEFDESAAHMDIEINEGKTLTKGDLVRYLAAISNETKNDISSIGTSTRLEGFEDTDEWSYLDSYFWFHITDGVYLVPPDARENWESGVILTGRYISDEEMANGADVVMLSNNQDITTDNQDGWDPATKAILNEDGTKATIFGKEYTVICTNRSPYGPMMPILSVPDDVALNSLSFSFYNHVTREQYNEVRDVADEVIPGVLTFAQMDIPDAEGAYMYRNIMLIAALIAVITIVNFAVLFRYITAKRRRQNAIFRLCGCTVGKIMRASLAECCMICIPTFIIGIAAFIPVMEFVLSNIFPYMKGAYSPVIYLAFVLIYTVLMLIIMSVVLFVQLRKMPVETLKRGGN